LNLYNVQHGSMRVFIGLFEDLQFEHIYNYIFSVIYPNLVAEFF
jgi:hypothetical protein